MTAKKEERKRAGSMKDNAKKLIHSQKITSNIRVNTAEEFRRVQFFSQM